MHPTISRRATMIGAAFGLTALSGCVTARAGSGEDALRALEYRSGGRLGVFVLESRSGRSLSLRGEERFSMCSTFKRPLSFAKQTRVG